MNTPYEPLRYPEVKQHGITASELIHRFKVTYKPLLFSVNEQDELYCFTGTTYTTCGTFSLFQSLFAVIVTDYPTHLQESLYTQLTNDITLPHLHANDLRTARFENGTYFVDSGVYVEHPHVRSERHAYSFSFTPTPLTSATQLYINALTGFNVKAKQELKQIVKRLFVYDKTVQPIIHTPTQQTSEALTRFFDAILTPAMHTRATWVALGRGYAKKAWSGKTTLIVKPLSLKYSSVTTPTIVPRLTKPEDFNEQLTLFGSYYPFHQRMNVLVFTDDLRQLQLIAPEDKPYLTVYQAPKLSDLSYNVCKRMPLTREQLNGIITWALCS